MTVQELIDESIDEVLLSHRKTDRREIRHDIEDLMLFSMKIGREKLILCKRKQIDKISEKIFRNSLREYMNHRPLAYIIHSSVFYNYNFFVNESCLIPRIDSEVLVEQAVEFARQKNEGRGSKVNIRLLLSSLFRRNGTSRFARRQRIITRDVSDIFNNKNNNNNNNNNDNDGNDNDVCNDGDNVECSKNSKKLKILDMCCGSGCLGLSLVRTLIDKYNFQQNDIELTLMDISSPAIQVALLNARRLDVKVKCVVGDILCGLGHDRYDIILCNPPYIETNTIDTLDEEVKRFEPRLALDGGGDGLRFYRFLSENIVRNLLPEGRVFLEIGYNQGVLTDKLFKDNGFATKILKDYGNKDRVLVLNTKIFQNVNSKY